MHICLPPSIDVVEISVFRNELFCLHGDGRLSHLWLVSPERCVERLMKRENWTLAATVCCMFQYTIITSRVCTNNLAHIYTVLHTILRKR